jgi:hypothetical protein
MFRSVESINLAKFNSSNSSEFLRLYESALDEDILGGETKTPSRTFAPSQIRCKRVSWFRLRGVEPEKESVVDRATNFTAMVGTACHRNIQEILSKKLDSDWVDPEEYLKLKQLPYKYSCIHNDYETQIEIFEPVPIKFAPDGIIYWKDKYWLLEIKTSEYSSFDKLSNIKPQHLDQVKCYATLLDIHNVLVLYQDRMYGGLKCYEVKITDDDIQEIWNMFNEVIDCVNKNIAPEKPMDRKYCTPSYCRYCKVCKEW